MLLRYLSFLTAFMLSLSAASAEDGGFSLNVNFQRASVTTPDGYVADTGASYASRDGGLNYGWSSGVGRRDRSSLTDGVASSVIVMRQSTWEVAVPNGVYAVSVVTGDVARPQGINSLSIEGQYVPDTDPLAANVTLEAIVSVSDGRLSITAADDAQGPTICAVSLQQNPVHVGANDGVVHGLLSTWYDNADFTNRGRVAVDPVLRHYWGGRSPWPGMDGELFTARWRGFLVADETATHNLRFRFNESCRVWLDGELVVDAWYSGKTWYDEYLDYTLTAGEPVEVTIEYRQRFRSSGIRILWKPSPGADPVNKETAYTHIPTGNLLPPVDVEAPTTPAAPELTTLTDTRLQLAWPAASDDVEVLHYNIYRNGRRIGTTADTVFIDTTASAATDYRYQIEAVDWIGKRSSLSERARTWERPRFTTANTSITSPAWVEGTVGAGADTLTLSVDGGSSFDAIRLGDTLWGADNTTKPLGITLNPTQRTTVTVTATGRGGQTASRTTRLRWAPTVIDVDTPESIVIRAGDSLLLTAGTVRRDTVAFDVNDDEDIDYTGNGRDRFPVRFDEPGVYTVRAIIDYDEDGEFDSYGETAGSTTVRVLDINFDGPIACEVGYRREKGVEVFPLSEADLPIWTSNDPSLLEVAVIPDDELSDEVLNNPDYNPANYGKRLYLKPTRRGSPVLMARVPETGAMIGFQAVDEFTQSTSSLRHLIVNTATRVGTTTYEIRPLVPDLDVTFDMFSHSSTFAGGVTGFTASTNDFKSVYDSTTGEMIGVYRVDIEVPAGESSYCFHLDVDQQSLHGTGVTRTVGVNGDSCDVTINPITICLDKSAQLTATITNKASPYTGNDTCFPLEIESDLWFATGPVLGFAGQTSDLIKINCADPVGTSYSDVVSSALFEVDTFTPECGTYSAWIDGTEFPGVVIVEACLDSMTIKEVGNEDNSVTNPSDDCLLIWPLPAGEAEIEVSADGESKASAIFKVDTEHTADPAEAFVTRTVTLTATERSGHFPVKIGVDCNRSNALDSSEEDDDKEIDVILMALDTLTLTEQSADGENTGNQVTDTTDSKETPTSPSDTLTAIAPIPAGLGLTSEVTIDIDLTWTPDDVPKSKIDSRRLRWQLIEWDSEDSIDHRGWSRRGGNFSRNNVSTTWTDGAPTRVRVRAWYDKDGDLRWDEATEPHRLLRVEIVKAGYVQYWSLLPVAEEAINPNPADAFTFKVFVADTSASGDDVSFTFSNAEGEAAGFKATSEISAENASARVSRGSDGIVEGKLFSQSFIFESSGSYTPVATFKGSAMRPDRGDNAQTIAVQGVIRSQAASLTHRFLRVDDMAFLPTRVFTIPGGNAEQKPPYNNNVAATPDIPLVDTWTVAASQPGVPLKFAPDGGEIALEFEGDNAFVELTKIDDRTLSVDPVDAGGDGRLVRSKTQSIFYMDGQAWVRGQPASPSVEWDLRPRTGWNPGLVLDIKTRDLAGNIEDLWLICPALDVANPTGAVTDNSAERVFDAGGAANLSYPLVTTDLASLSDGAKAAVFDRCVWQIENSAAVAPTYAPQNRTGQMVTVTHATVPGRYDAYGRYRVRLQFTGKENEWRWYNDIEYLWNNTGTGASGAASTNPNWFHYYLQMAADSGFMPAVTTVPGAANANLDGLYESTLFNGRPPQNALITIYANTGNIDDPAHFAETLVHENGHHEALFFPPDRGGFGAQGIYDISQDEEPRNRINDAAEGTPGAFGQRDDGMGGGYDHVVDPSQPGSGHAHTNEALITAAISAAMSEWNFVVTQAPSRGPYDD